MRISITKFKKAIILIFIFFQNISLFSQGKGGIAGSVIDSETGEAIVGANVLIENTIIGSATDLNGKFRILDVPEGTYNLIVSYISYKKQIIKDVVVIPNKIIEIKIALKPDVIETEEILVVAESDESYENALLNRRKKSINISDGISAEQIKKSTDNTISEAIKRLPGITLMDNRFVIIRGTNERYNNVQLNNTSLSSTEPEKRSFSFDLLPTNLINHTTILKSFTPDIPGDFGGGFVQLNTVDFPENLKINLSLSSSYVTNTTLRSYSSYASGTNFLGFDNGSRSIPSNFPSDLSNANLTRDEINNLAKTFNNIWSPTSKKAPLNSNFSFSVGDGARLIGQQFGFVTAFNYRNSYKNTKIVRNEYEASGEPRFSYAGNQSTNSTTLGGILNLSFKLSPFHKFSLKNTYTHSSDDEVSQFRGNQYTDAGKEQIHTALRYVERGVLSSQLIGEHVFENFLKTKLEWRAFLSNSKRIEPDYRRVIYGRDIGTDDPFYAILGFQPNLKNGGRFFSNLYDKSRGFSFDVTIPLSSNRLKFGSLYDWKNRDFASRLISVIINAPGNGYTDFNLLYLPLDKIFAAENFRRNGFSIDEYANGSNNYNASQEIWAGYGMIEIPINVFSRELIFIGGARLENSLQKINSMDISGKTPINNHHKNVDILPSLNFIYRINEKTNLRLSYSQTVNRPELRELAPFVYFDFSTQTSVYGNPQLKRALIRNYDFRYEFFPSFGEVISISSFYKSISNAIEKAVVTGTALSAERTFVNSEDAKVYGFELESRFSLGFFGEYFNNFTVSTNYTWIKSVVNVKATDMTIARSSRPLQGQSPYVINVGLFYVEPTLNTSISILYNRIGERIVEVSTLYQEDIIEKPRDLIDIKITQKLSEGLELNIGIRDLLAKDQVFMQGDKLSRLNSNNTNISFGLTYKLQ